MTTIPTVVYPTLSPTKTITPSPLPGMICSEEPVKIICRATVCVVRNSPQSGKDHVAYTVPHSVVLEGARSCQCPSCAPLERDWFFLGQSQPEDQFWAINMNQVWELYNGE